MRRVADAPPVAVRRRPVRAVRCGPARSVRWARSVRSVRERKARPCESGFRSWTRRPSSTSSRNSPSTQADERSMPSRTKPSRSAEGGIATSQHRGVVRQRLDPQPPQAAHAETAVAQRRDHVGDELKPQPPTGGDRRGAFRSSAHRLQARVGVAAWACRRGRVPARATQAVPGRGRGRRRSGWPGPGFWGRGGCGRRRARR